MPADPATPEHCPPEITVVVRSHNDRDLIRDTLTRLCEQTVADRMEILLFDDDSTDGTLEIAATFPSVTIVPWDGLPYNPPRVLNRAVDAAHGKYIVFNNSDAVPCSRDAVERIVAPLSDPGVGAVYGNQLPRTDALPLVRKDYERAFGDGTVAASWGFMFSLVFSAVRTDVARRIRFNPAFQYSEDIDWALRIRESGLRIVYEKDAVVVHSHNYAPEILRKRFYNEGIANGMLYGAKPSFCRAFLGFAAESARDMLYLCRHHELGYCFRGLRYRWTQRMSCFRGEKYAWRQDFFHRKDSRTPLVPKS
ncbi:MAG: glycosyltransferase [Lentisphaeria bacterium]|nr:glycosyltransferase [Lentisphaeria bacterium]